MGHGTDDVVTLGRCILLVMLLIWSVAVKPGAVCDCGRSLVADGIGSPLFLSFMGTCLLLLEWMDEESHGAEAQTG